MERVKCIIPSAETEKLYPKDTYEVIKRNKLLDFAIKFLLKHKIIEPFMDTKTTFKLVTISNTDLVEHIREAINGYYRMHLKMPTRIMVGYPQVKELEFANRYVEIRNVQVQCNVNDRISIYGVNIKVSPYIDGVVILDD